MTARRSHPATTAEVESFLAANPVALGAFRAVQQHLDGLGGVELRLAATQVSWSRHRGFAFLWLPRTWLGSRGAAAVLSLALTERVTSPRWKQVVEVRPGLILHHLELASAADVDAEVRAWLERAWSAAA